MIIEFPHGQRRAESEGEAMDLPTFLSRLFPGAVREPLGNQCTREELAAPDFEAVQAFTVDGTDEALEELLRAFCQSVRLSVMLMAHSKTSLVEKMRKLYEEDPTLELPTWLQTQEGHGRLLQKLVAAACARQSVALAVIEGEDGDDPDPGDDLPDEDDDELAA